MTSPPPPPWQDPAQTPPPYQQPGPFAPPPAPPWQMPAGQPAYYQPPPTRSVAKGGISEMGLVVHIVLSVLTFWLCGGWLWVWFFHWLFTRNKTTTVTTAPVQQMYPQPPQQPGQYQQPPYGP